MGANSKQFSRPWNSHIGKGKEIEPLTNLTFIFNMLNLQFFSEFSMLTIQLRDTLHGIQYNWAF